MKVKLIDLLKEEIIEQGGKFRDAVNLQGKSVANVARIGDDGTVKSTYTRIYPKTQKSESLEGYDESRALELVDLAKKYLGIPYSYGGCNPSVGLDCSCYVKTLFDEFGYELPYRTADQQQNYAEQINESELREGDLIFFNTDNNTNDIDHVGIVISPPNSDQIDMIHASSSNGIEIQKNIKSNSYWSPKIVSFGRYPIYGSSYVSDEISDSDYNTYTDTISGSYSAAGQKNPYDALHSFQSRRSDGFGGKLNEKVFEGIKKYKRDNRIKSVDILGVNVSINPETLVVNWSVKIGPSKDGYTYEIIDSRGKAGGNESMVDSQLSSMHSNHSGLEPKLVTYFKQKVPIWYNNDGDKNANKSGEILIHQKFFKYGKKLDSV
jgi:hypothetical protein